MAEYVTVWVDDLPDLKCGEEVVRCRDCKHATLSSLGFCKYCEKFVLPDEDGFGPDPRVNLPLDFFCAYGERSEDA